MLEGAHGQLVVELRARGNGHDVGPGLIDHLVEVCVPGPDPQLPAQGLEQLGDQIAEPDDLGAGMLVVGAGRGRAATTTAQNGDAVDLLDELEVALAGSSIAEKLPRIKKYLDAYDFDAALLLLEGIEQAIRAA